MRGPSRLASDPERAPGPERRPDPVDAPAGEGDARLVVAPSLAPFSLMKPAGRGIAGHDGAEGALKAGALERRLAAEDPAPGPLVDRIPAAELQADRPVGFAFDRDGARRAGARRRGDRSSIPRAGLALAPRKTLSGPARRVPQGADGREALAGQARFGAPRERAGPTPPLRQVDARADPSAWTRLLHAPPQRPPSRRHRLATPSRASRRRRAVRGGDAGGRASRAIAGSRQDIRARIACAIPAPGRETRYETGESRMSARRNGSGPRR